MRALARYAPIRHGKRVMTPADSKSFPDPGDLQRAILAALQRVGHDKTLSATDVAHALEGKIAGEIATRARQAGVPCHAIVGSNGIDRFSARILDLQVILEASTRSELEAAGEQLGHLLERREA